MDFGDTLDKWDQQTAKSQGKKKQKNTHACNTQEENPLSCGSNKESIHSNPLDVWLRQNPVQDKDSLNSEKDEVPTPAERRRQLKRMKPEATIDLHGCTRDDAWAQLTRFVSDCHRKGVRKILIIHGKGLHSGNEAVLIQLVKNFIEQNIHTGESGHSDREDGGSGSTWVILK